MTSFGVQEFFLVEVNLLMHLSIFSWNSSMLRMCGWYAWKKVIIHWTICFDADMVRWKKQPMFVANCFDIKSVSL